MATDLEIADNPGVGPGDGAVADELDHAITGRENGRRWAWPCEWCRPPAFERPTRRATGLSTSHRPRRPRFDAHFGVLSGAVREREAVGTARHDARHDQTTFDLELLKGGRSVSEHRHDRGTAGRL